MTDPIDLGPAARRVLALAETVRDDQLADPTPCSEYSVADLLDHLMGLSLAFRAAAVKQPLAGGPSGDGAALPDDWRAVLADRVTALAEAWRDEAAWQGEATAGGITMPAAVMGVVALDELVLHGWDLAAALGAEYDCSEAEAAAILEFLSQGDSPVFGEPVPVPEDASTLDRAVGRSGRDPGWRP